MGFVIAGSLRPSYYYGKQHDYVYYPTSWTDTITNTTYEGGYYDENGQYYKSVAFPKNGIYENVVCRCPYCGRESILNLAEEDVFRHDLECRYCGGPMEIQSELDEYIGQGARSERPNTHVYASEESLRKFREPPKRGRSGCLISVAIAFIVLVFLLVFLCVLGSNSIAKQEKQNALQSGQPVLQNGQNGNNSQNQPDQQDYTGGLLPLEDHYGGFGETVALNRTDKAGFVITNSADSDSADKLLLWDRDAESYFDPDTDCWLWYNRESSPAVWQYWYEGISSDFGDYGWMEHDDTGWYIEKDYGEWIELPGKYDTSKLWYIEE